MKLQILLYSFAFLCIGCNSGSKNNENKDEKEVPTEEIQKSIKDSYLIADNSAGKFKTGTQIPFPETSDTYKISKETQTRMTEEGPEEETIYIVNENSEYLLTIAPEYNFETGNYTQNIGEIIILSEKFKTQDGIGVHSTIQDFIKTYPNYKIWYTYVSGMYVIETEELNAQFILSEKDFIGELTITSDMIPLTKTDFNATAKIIKIRIL